MDAQRGFQNRDLWRVRQGRGLPAAIAGLGAALALGAPMALAVPLSTPDPEVQVSGTSPPEFPAGCGLEPGVPPGDNFLNSEVEPWVDVNPVDVTPMDPTDDNIVAFWQQDRWSNGGARANVAGVSLDGGATWETVVVPGLTNCSPPNPGGTDLNFDRASDPWVSFAPDGTLHQISLVFDADPALANFGPNGLAVSKSTDGGLNWTDPILIIEDDQPNILNDKQSLTADPTDANFVYAVWDRLRVPPGSVINPENVVGLGFKSPFFFARSTDGGDTWEPARRIYDPGGNNQTIGHQLVVLPDGTLVDFFDEILNFRNDDGDAQFDLNLSLLRSPDKGDTWLPRGRPIRIADIQSLGVVTPDTGQGVRDADILFDVAVDPDNGNLYAVWQDSRFSGFDQIAFMMSTDSGLTWSAPIKVNQTPENDDNPLRQQGFIPSVVVAGADGTIAVTYYDFRNDDDAGELVDHFAVSCLPSDILDCSDQASWTPDDEVRLTATSFNILEAPVAGGLFLGDYVGLASDGSEFLSVYAKSGDPAGDPATIFFRRAVGLPVM
jgi:hypothetical protein